MTVASALPAYVHPITGEPLTSFGRVARAITQQIPGPESGDLQGGGWAVVIEGRPYPLANGRARIVGSGMDCDLRIESRHVSRRHCAVTRRGAQVWVQDLESTNGVWVEGTRVHNTRVDHLGTFQVGRQAVVLAEQVGQRAVDSLRWNDMIGRDPGTLRLWSQLASAATSDAPVWLHGETGTGKERAALALHRASPKRSHGPWVALNCAALPPELAESELFGVTKGAFTGAHKTRPGAFSRADGGTLLLDEVGELPLTIQAKLLRVLETGEVLPVGGDQPVKVDVRVVAATWRDLEDASREGRFRADLLHRLWVLKISIPPLRERPRDVAAMLDVLLTEASAPHLWPDRALMRALEDHVWFGNVRELRNHVRRAITADSVVPLMPVEVERALAIAPRYGRDRSPTAAAHALRATLAEVRGNRSAAARALGVSRSTLYRWIDRLASES